MREVKERHWSNLPDPVTELIHQSELAKALFEVK
jgi:hypothetical protein